MTLDKRSSEFDKLNLFDSKYTLSNPNRESRQTGKYSRVGSDIVGILTY